MAFSNSLAPLENGMMRSWGDNFLLDLCVWIAMFWL